uniref:Uncharacterized protein n=1 Tax=Leersia perrieri TaxID=77586 RepID=A0A0D9XTX9_9ORYZ
MEGTKTEAVAVGDGDRKPSAAKVRMPQAYVSAILTTKTDPPPSAQELERLSPQERVDAIYQKELFDEFLAFQAEVRSSVLEKGYYLVDESYLEEAAADKARMDEELAKIDYSRIIFGEWDYEDKNSVKIL